MVVCHRLEELRAQQSAEITHSHPSASPSSSASSSSPLASAPTAYPILAAFPSSSSSSTTPDLAFYIRQHTADQHELASLRHQLHQLQQSTTTASAQPPALPSLQSLLGTVSSVVCALQLLYVGAWLWRQASARRRVSKSWWEVLEDWLSGMVGWFAG